MNKLIYFLFAFALLVVSCSKDDEPTKENPLIENPDGGKNEEEDNDTPEDRTEVQHVMITATVSNNFRELYALVPNKTLAGKLP